MDAANLEVDADKAAEAFRQHHLQNTAITVENVIGIANLTYAEALYVLLKMAMTTAMTAYDTPQEGLAELEMMLSVSIEKTRANLANPPAVQ